jgi:hypothetical protein
MKNINVQWLLDGEPKSLQEIFCSNLASIRMRAALTMQMQKENIKIDYIRKFEINRDTNILGIGKFSIIRDPDQINKWLKIIEKHKRNNGKIFLDYTDHHLRDSNSGNDLYNAYQKFLFYSDYVVTSSEYLKKEIEKIKKIKTYVIEDPIEIKITQPKLFNHETLTALWFGHASNLDYLFNFLITKFQPVNIIKIIIMTNYYPLPAEMIKNLENYISKNIELAVVPWSLNDLEVAASISDLCIIPCGVNDNRKAGVSSNRLITGLALGLPCFADSPLSYQEFSEYYGPLEIKHIEDFSVNPEKYREKTKLAQKIIKERFAKNKINDKWELFFQSII